MKQNAVEINTPTDIIIGKLLARVVLKRLKVLVDM